MWIEMNQKRIRAEIEKSHPAPPHSGRDAAYLQRIHQMCLEHPDYDKQSPQMQHLFDTYPLYRKGDAVVFALRLRQAAFHLATVMVCALCARHVHTIILIRTRKI